MGGGPPIVAAGLVWTIGQGGTLYGLNPSTGTTRQHAAIGSPANHFPTPGVGDGLLLAASAQKVVAFAATTSRAAVPGALSTISTTLSSQHGAGDPAVISPTGSGGLDPDALTALVVGGVVLLGGLFWLAFSGRRRRSARS